MLLNKETKRTLSSAQGSGMNKWYMHNSESVQENEKLKLLMDFEIQTDLLISARVSLGTTFIWPCATSKQKA